MMIVDGVTSRAGVWFCVRGSAVSAAFRAEVFRYGWAYTHEAWARAFYAKRAAGLRKNNLAIRRRKLICACGGVAFYTHRRGCRQCQNCGALRPRWDQSERAWVSFLHAVRAPSASAGA